MLLDLKPILVTPGASLPFETREDLSGLVFGSCRPASEPILASGKVRNTAGVLELTGELSTTLHGVCDRCAGEFTRAVQIPVHAVLVSEEELEQTEDAVTIGISDTSEALSDSRFSLACACLSMTCMELLPVKEITVVSGSRNTTIRRDSLILKDTIQPQEDKS